MGSPVVNVPIERAWYLGFQLLITIVYLFFVFRLLQNNQRKDQGWKWLKNIQMALWILSGIYAVTTPLFFILSNYLVLIRSIFQISISLFIHLLGVLILRESHILGNIGKNKKNDLSLNDQLVENLKQRISTFMNDGKPWLKSDFSLRELSHAIDSNSLYTSTILNQSFGQNFNDFVNNYRVEKAKELLEQNEMKLFAVALESGFSNKNSFNRVLRK